MPYLVLQRLRKLMPQSFQQFEFAMALAVVTNNQPAQTLLASYLRNEPVLLEDLLNAILGLVVPYTVLDDKLVHQLNQINVKSHVY